MAKFPDDAGPNARASIHSFRVERKALRQEILDTEFELKKVVTELIDMTAENVRLKEMLDGWHQREQARLAGELVMGIEAKRLSNIAYQIWLHHDDHFGRVEPDEDALRDMAVGIDLKVALARKCQRLVLQIRYPEPPKPEEESS